MEVKINSALLGMLVALVLVFLFMSYNNSKRLDDISSKQKEAAVNTEIIAKILKDPTQTTIIN